MPRRSARSSHGSASAHRPGARECPPERVVAVDRGPVGTGAARETNRFRRPDAVVGPEDRALEVDAQPVRGQHPVDGRDGGSLARRRHRPTLPVEQVAEQRDELRQRHGGRRPPCRRDRGPEPTPCGVDPGLLLERENVAGEDRERRAHVPRGCVDEPVAERELRELHVRPRRGLGDASRGVEREIHRRGGAATVAGQLTRVGDAGVGGEARLHGRHPVERPRRPAGNARARSGRRPPRRRAAPRTAHEAVPRDRGRAPRGSRDGSGRGCRARASRPRPAAVRSSARRSARSERGRNEGSPVSRQRSW